MKIIGVVTVLKTFLVQTECEPEDDEREALSKAFANGVGKLVGETATLLVAAVSNPVSAPSDDLQR
jgi:hypothetical protein